MGLVESVPQIDSRGQKAIALGQLKDIDIRRFAKVFKRIDKELLGKIFVDDFFTYLGEPRSMFSDALFELNDTPLGRGMLSFGDFLQTVVVYCLFEPPEIQKFVYFTLDKDKNGYIKTDDLELYVKVINQVELDEELESNLGKGWEKLKKEFHRDGRVDFKEFMVFNAEWPAMFYPAYRLQQRMMERTLGRKWWQKKRRAMQDARDDAREADKRKKRAAQKKEERIRQRKIRRRMGSVMYYLCSCVRYKYDTPPEPLQEVHELTEEEKRALARQAKQEQARQELLQQRNAPTLEYLKFQEKRTQLMEQWSQERLKPKRVFRERRDRADERREKWKGRIQA